MVKVLLSLKAALSAAEKDPGIKEFADENKAYLVSTHAIIASEDSISTWGLNYYSPALDQAKTFKVSQEIGMETTIAPEGLSSMREKDLLELGLSGAASVQELLDKAYKKKIGAAANIIITASHPKKYKAPILRVNFISSQLAIQSLILNMKTKKILSNKTDNVTGTTVVAGTIKKAS